MSATSRPRSTQREKQGFSAPDASWFRGESIDYVTRRLLGTATRASTSSWTGRRASLVGEHLDGRQNRRLLIWSLLNVESWCEQFG